MRLFHLRFLAASVLNKLGFVSDYIDNFVGDDAHIVPQEITPYSKRGDVGIAPYNITI